MGLSAPKPSIGGGQGQKPPEAPWPPGAAKHSIMAMAVWGTGQAGVREEQAVALAIHLEVGRKAGGF